MKKVQVLILTILLLIACSSYTVKVKLNGKSVTQTLQIDDNYTEIEVNRAINVFMNDTVSMAFVEADEALIQYFQYKIKGNCLVLTMRENISLESSGNKKSSVKVYLPLKDGINDIKLSGASSFVCGNPLSANELSIELTGASYLKGDIIAKSIKAEISGASKHDGYVEARKLIMNFSGASKYDGTLNSDNASINVSGASDIRFDGIVDQLRLKLSGASHLEGRQIADLNADISGASHADVDCSGTIKCKVSGASKLIYSGNASIENIDSSGASVVRKK